MQWRCREAKSLGTHTLQGYQLVFRFYADIIPSQYNSVKGGLWEISENDEIALDRYEGHPDLYEKVYEGEIMFYRMCDENRDFGLPSPGYLEGMLEGMENFGLNPLVDLNSNLGNPIQQEPKFVGDRIENAMQIIANALKIEL